jgi:hypothetical protein
MLMDAQIQKYMRVSTITESGGAGSGTWTVSFVPSDAGPGESRPHDVNIISVTLQVAQGAAQPVPAWAFRVGLHNLIGIDVQT